MNNPIFLKQTQAPVPQPPYPVWLDLVLETLRGNNRAEVAVAIDNHSYATCHGGPMNAGDKGGRGRLRSYCADANRVGFASNTKVADIDIVTAGGETETS